MFSKIYNYIVDSIFPKDCICCHQGDIYLCPSCFKKIDLITKDICFLCNKENSLQGVCDQCREESFLDEIYVPAAFSNSVMEKSVHSLKYDFIEELGEILSKLLADKIGDKIFESAIMIPVPLHKKRFLERGYNQSSLIAKPLSELMKIDYSDKIVQRVKKTTQQAKLLRVERLENLKNAFQCVDKEKVKGKTVLLVDDVITSGTTINEVAKILKQAGADKVVALALAHG